MTNFAPPSCGGTFLRKNLFNNAGFDAMFKRSEKLLVFQGIAQHWKFFDVKRNIVSEICKETPNDIFAEFCRSCPVKNISNNRLNPGEFQIDGISAKYTAESTKKYISTRQIKF